MARLCVAPPKCLLCTEAGLPGGHRMGGPACRPPARASHKGKGGRAAKVAATVSTPIAASPTGAGGLPPHGPARGGANGDQ